MEYVFVYGTLKRGFSNNFVMGNSEFVGQCITVNDYFLTQGRFYPMLIDAQPGKKIKGELFLVETSKIPSIDRFEGHPNLFNRQKILVRFHEKNIEAWCYFYTNLEQLEPGEVLLEEYLNPRH